MDVTTMHGGAREVRFVRGGRIDATDAIAAILPQTQCTRCGYADCDAYAAAIAGDGAPIDRCPPGGVEGIGRLSAVTGASARTLDPSVGVEGPRRLAVIDEAACIGCRLCLKACPVDAIVGGPKSMHGVSDLECTGCELCVPSCPVDCISLVPASGAATGWSAWSQAQADRARDRYGWHRERGERDRRERASRLGALAPVTADRATGSGSGTGTDAEAELGAAQDRTSTSARALVDAALARVRARRAAEDERP